MRRVAALLWCVAVLAGCGDDQHPVATAGPESTVGAPAAVPGSFDEPPLPQASGSPFAGDGRAAWYGDFRSLARWDVAEATWQVLPLPFREVGALAMQATGDGGVVGAALTCARSCEDGVDLRVEAWAADAGGARRIDALDPVPVGHGSLLLADGRVGDEALFRVLTGDSTSVLRIGPDGASIHDLDGSIRALCPTADGFVGVRSDTAAGLQVAPRSVVASVDGRTFTEVPDDARVRALLDEPASAAVCRGDVLALVGAERAVELLPSGEVVEVPSAVGDLVAPPLFGSPGVSSPDGSFWISGTTGPLHRDASGWRRDTRFATGFAVVGGELVAYPWVHAALPSEPPEPSG